MVLVENCTLVPISTLEELEATVVKGLERRHISGTQMNAESSRSHLILSIIIESTNLQTQVQVKGKVKFNALLDSPLPLFILYTMLRFQCKIQGKTC